MREVREGRGESRAWKLCAGLSGETTLMTGSGGFNGVEERSEKLLEFPLKNDQLA